MLSFFYIRDNVKINLLFVNYITFICKTTVLPVRITFDYTNYTLDSRNFSKGADILFLKNKRICVIVTKKTVLRLFYTCHFCMIVKFVKTKIVKIKD